jgi:mannose-6-phosphate isomerase-like protein (cupin superfamily)
MLTYVVLTHGMLFFRDEEKKVNKKTDERRSFGALCACTASDMFEVRQSVAEGGGKAPHSMLSCASFCDILCGTFSIGLALFKQLHHHHHHDDVCPP